VCVKEGEQIKADQPILELENEKAVASIPSPAAGKVTKVHVQPGQKISVGQVLVSLSEETAAPQQTEGKAAGSPAAPSAKESPTGPPKPEQPAPAPAHSASGPAASPSIRRMAKELGIDLARVHGSERGGRIVLADLRAYIQRLQEAFYQAKPGTPQAGRPAAESIDFSKWGPVRKEKATALRKTIARRMLESWNSIPHVTQFDDADLTVILDLRKKYVAAYEKKQAHLTVTSFVLKALVATLQKHPIFNSSLDETTDEIVFKQYYHIGVAVDTEHGLMVPVLRDVDKKSMLDLSVELSQIADKAKARKVTADEMKGGTFTISIQASSFCQSSVVPTRF
jgi:pyruvate dehydrogenase E2 component (dihydrolipoamide acetyltransferase)